jgi:Tfp pilus assembly protein PilZ
VPEETDDRRRAERVPINDELSTDDSTWVSDLSIGGVFVHTNELVPIGTVVELRFTVLLDDPLVIEATGKVVRHSRRPSGIGVQFSSLSPLMRMHVEQVLARQRPLDSGKPLHLPDPGHAPLPSSARATPAGDLRVPDDDDDVTSSFPRIPVVEAPTMIFRPPPMPGKRPSE